MKGVIKRCRDTPHPFPLNPSPQGTIALGEGVVEAEKLAREAERETPEVGRDPRLHRDRGSWGEKRYGGCIKY